MAFFRVIAVHKNNTHRFSNILLLEHKKLNQSLYPNPCLHQLFLESAEEIQAPVWATAYDGRKIKLNYTKLGKTIKMDVSMLSTGMYSLQMISKGVLRQIPFVKL